MGNNFDDGYVRVLVDVPGTGPVLHLYRMDELQPGEVEVLLDDPLSDTEVGRASLAWSVAEVALGDLLR